MMIKRPTEKQAQDEMERILREQLKRQTSPIKLDLAATSRAKDQQEQKATTRKKLAASA